MIEIRHRYTGHVIYRSDTAATIRQALEEAVAGGAYLVGADLGDTDLRGARIAGAYLGHANFRAADLRGADLHGASLTDAYFVNAYLRYASLYSADLSNSDLSNAYLVDADLRYANFRYASLRGANLDGANLGGAYLRGANLDGADLRGARLVGAREDLYAIYAAVPNEVPAVLAALRAGKVDGSTYEGACACLVGTIANARGCRYNEIPSVRPDPQRPAERLFTAILPGHTSQKNPIAALVEEWTESWLRSNVEPGQ